MAKPRSSAPPSEWPGRHFGLPASGPRSIVRFGRRLAAFVIDIGVGALISYAFFDYDRWASLAVFAALQIIFLVLVSGSVGHLLLGMRVVPLTSGWIGIWRPVVRTLLLSLLVPALITDRDRRGLHDRIAGTVLVRR
ncbi:RDD family protein [Frigoribacterium sp. CG_9.8]|uniref:RDD family protein n=1 Tax=Frigoribacterium sp. CG_9.8 TaxID=2787733 RepID=UPI0018CBA44C|nr:RDD family protein [Frigoribacterium sp. CG_9.8]MBG6108001.1 putative RDD family membrane protein YckC [Frigoribacterium sp. CG_9.8]